MGRFQSRDTFEGYINTPASLNRFNYAHSNPVMNTDPSGHSVQSHLAPIIYNQARTSSQLISNYVLGNHCLQLDNLTMTAGAGISDFWLGFWKEAYRVHIWFNPFPSVQHDLEIKNNESDAMLLGRLTADIISIAVANSEMGTAELLFMAGPAECVAGFLVDGIGEFITCPGAAMQMAGATLLAGQAVASGSIAVVDGMRILSILGKRGGTGSGASGSHSKYPGPYRDLEDPPNVGSGKDFTDAQKMKALEANRARNGGIVKSDISGQELVQPAKSQKGVVPDPNEWQFDHIIPKDQGGTNSFDNLQIISRAENRAKSNIFPYP